MLLSNIQEIQTQLKNVAKEWGADLVGFCALDTTQPLLSKDMSTYTHAISIAVKLSDGVLKTIEDGPSFMYFQHYRTANALLDNIAFRLARKIEELGYLAFPVAASQSLGKNNPYRGVVPHKTIAALSGLGFVGKSGLFLFFYATVENVIYEIFSSCKEYSNYWQTTNYRKCCYCAPIGNFSKASFEVT